MVNKQVITDDYAIYSGDSAEVLTSIPDESVGLSVYSPPFASKGGVVAGLYQYSSSNRDLSNSPTYEQFLEHYKFIIQEIYRATKPGRLSCVHICDVPAHKNGLLTDFPGDVIKIHEQVGWGYSGRFAIWKDPLKIAIRLGYPTALKHGQIVEDATRCRPALPDYVCIFVKPGENWDPVTHPTGLGFGVGYYAGETPLTTDMIEKYGTFESLKNKWIGFEGDQRENKLGHVIWQRYASPVWDDIRIDNVLKYKEARENEEEKHVHPLQLDVYDRCIDLYTNKGDVVLEPFLGVGSGVYAAVSTGRKAIGIELKETYFNQAADNLKSVEDRFVLQQELF